MAATVLARAANCTPPVSRTLDGPARKRPDCRTAGPRKQGLTEAFKRRLTQADNQRWCTTLGCLARISIGGRAPVPSLDEKAVQHRDGGTGLPLPGTVRGARR
jgi:hypothetical protein